MAGQSDDTRVTEEEVSQLAGKLGAWAETLPEHEKFILSWIVSRAQAAGEAEPEVSGYALNFNLSFPQSPALSFSNQLAKAAGFGFGNGSTEIIFFGN